MAKERLHALRMELRRSRFLPKTWEFWRTTILCFALCCMLGHWLEIPYCTFNKVMFGIVADDYATMVDPWYYPYWVYGFGALAMTFVLEPIKEHIIKRRKTLWGAFLMMYVLTVLIAAVCETGFGLIINQPDPVTGLYPFWDNSQLPLNILQQGWLVNDLLIGAAAMIYLWLIFPLIYIFFSKIGHLHSNHIFGLLMALFLVCVIMTIVS